MLILQRARDTHTSRTGSAEQQQSREAVQRSAATTNDEVRHVVESRLIGFRRTDRSFLRRLFSVFWLLFTVEWVMAFWFGPQPPELIRGEKFQATYRIDINQATWVEWLQLEGIGPALAHRLQVDREIRGPYESVDDLRRVSGIGPATIERLRPWLIEPSGGSEQSTEEPQSDEAEGPGKDADNERPSES